MAQLPAGIQLGGFASPALRAAIGASGSQAIRPRTDIGLGPIPDPILQPTAVADTGVSTPSASFAAAGPQITPKAETTQAASTGQVATPLGGLLNLASQGARGVVGAITEPFKKGFVTDDIIAGRAAQLTEQGIENFLQANDMVLEDLTAEQVSSIQEQAQQQAQQSAAGQNLQAFTATVGLQAGLSGLQHALAERAIDTQVEAMSRQTERLINGLEFNTRLREQARNIVEMKERLKIIDSIMTQAESGLAGNQRQMFLRRPDTGRRL